MKVTRSQGGCPKGKRLTQTDYVVLQKIAKLGFQDYAELRSGPLKDFGRQHSWACMKKLVQMDLLTVARGDAGEIRGWFLTTKGARRFEHMSTDDGWAITDRSPSYRTSYHHDHVLRELQALLEMSPVIQKWVTEQRLRRDLMRRFFFLHAHDKGEKVGALPDALLYLRSGNEDSKAALELEMTRKSRKRLFKKFESHIISPDFDFVLYVVDGRPLLRLLWDVYKEVMEKSIYAKFAKEPNGIYFAELSMVRSQGLRATFKGIQDSFSLEDLAT